MPFPFKSLLFSGLSAIALAVSSATAQISITATVNGKPITNYDIEQRALFLGYATNIEVTEQNRDRLFEDALQLLIDDKLRLEAARTLISWWSCRRDWPVIQPTHPCLIGSAGC